jgi:nicotinamide mononucleotide transporter
VSGTLDQLAAISVADWVAIVTGALYALLAVKRVRWCWVAGALSSAVLTYIAWRERLPMQAALQLFYVAMAGYGFWRWSQTGADSELRISRWPWSWHVGISVSLCALAWFAGPLLARWTQAAWPRLDTLVMLGSLLATWMTAQAKLENWLYWIVIDVASIYLYFMQDASGAALLYLIYTGIAVSGAIAWARLYRLQERLARA